MLQIGKRIRRKNTFPIIKVIHMPFNRTRVQPNVSARYKDTGARR